MDQNAASEEKVVIDLENDTENDIDKDKAGGDGNGNGSDDSAGKGNSGHGHSTKPPLAAPVPSRPNSDQPGQSVSAAAHLIGYFWGEQINNIIS